MKNKILLVGGGTGGHIVPVVNIYNYLKKNASDLEIYVVGNGSLVERNFYSHLNNYYVIRTGKFDRHSIFSNLVQVILFLSGLVQSFRLLRKIRPKVIFAKGGYVSYPIVFWARILGIPYFIHESDITMGRANMSVAKHAEKVFVGFPESNYKSIDQKKLRFVGQILSHDEKKDTDFDFGFSDSKKVIFVTGGSLGAQSINKCVYRSLPEILKSYNIIHQVGIKNYNEALEVRAELPDNFKNSYFISGFLRTASGQDLMPAALKRAGVVVARAGATTIAEIIEAKRPMILVPYPHASGDHQMKNAVALEKKGGCVLLDEKNLTPVELSKTITKTLQDGEKTKAMVSKAEEFFPSNGVKVVCEEIIHEVSK